ncbi:FAD-dependent oxidoreductase [Henriciella sp. AS95]|uniref:FAD-dependent oxidoreductase n=1 Tax=Henriciella sp. AS95 TaxID=3135782 RepID=UPI00316BD40C
MTDATRHTVADVDYYDVTVLGAGISGLTLAHDFAATGHSVLLVDAYQHAGGNHQSFNVGGMSFDVGAIFFWSDYPQFQMFPELFEQTIPLTWSFQRVTPAGKLAKYPLDLKLDLAALPKAKLVRVLFSGLRARLAGNAKTSAYEFLRYYLGETLMRTSGILNYVHRFYGLPAKEISYDFAEARMEPIARNATVTGVLGMARKKFGAKVLNNETFCVARPKTGFPDYYALAIDTLRAKGVTVRLGTSIEQIVAVPDGTRIRLGDRTVKSRRTISTLPMQMTAEIAGCAGEDAPASKGLHSLYCRFRGERGFQSLILYNFHERGRWKRLTMHSDYYGKDGDWEYFSVEVTADDDTETAENLFDDLRTTTQAFGLFQGTLELAGSQYTDFAYPLYDHSSAKRRDALIKNIEAAGLELAGRQGRFQYLPTSDHTIKDTRATIEVGTQAEA